MKPNFPSFAHLTFCFFVLALTVLAGPVSLDTSFNATGYVIDHVGSASFGSLGKDIAIQSDGKIIVSGSTWETGPWQLTLARLNQDGSYDTTFGNGTGKVVPPIGQFVSGESVFVQPDGKIVQSGFLFNANSNSTDFFAARYLPNGSLDNTFDGNGLVSTNRIGMSDDLGYASVLQTDGKIVVVGTTASDQTAQTDLLIVRYNTNGSLDGTFLGGGILTISFPDFSERAYSVALQPDGKIVMAGYLPNSVGEARDLLLVRLNANGSIDSNFGTGGVVVTPVSSADDEVYTVLVLPDGKIVAGGRSSAMGVVVRYNSNGTPDATFGADGVVFVPSTVRELIRTHDGKLLAGGGGAPFVTRINTNGTIDTSFNNGGTFTAAATGYICSGTDAALQSNGRILLLGSCNGGFSPPFYKFGVFRAVETVNPPSVSPFDFEGDRKSDIAIYRNSAGEWWWHRSIDDQVRAVQFGSSADVIAPEDFTGDGKTDHALFRPASGEWFILRSEDGTFYSFPFGINGDIPVPADYDGDGEADTAVFRPSNSLWIILQSSTQQAVFVTFGLPGDRPVPADYDGDRKADIGIFRPASANGAEWWVQRSTEGLMAVQFGAVTDKAVPADFTGDGKADVAFYREGSPSQWFVLRSEDFSFFAFPWGSPGDIAVQGDYDGDGKADPGVFRASQATWYINRSGGSGPLISGFGVPGDQPVANAYVR